MSGLLELSADDYHADKVAAAPSLSSSLVKLLCDDSPRHAWTAHPKLNPLFEREDADRFDIGTAAHALLLQGEEIAVVIDAPDWRTKDAKEQRDTARAEGKLPLLAGQWVRVQQMVEAAVAQIDAVDATPGLFAPGKAEQTLVWEDDGVTCRARIDWLHDDHRAIDDLKTTGKSANPESWSRTLFNIGADVQVAFYLRGCRSVLGCTPAFRFIVIETQPPYALSCVSLAPDALALADRKVGHAIDVWRRCLETDVWPAYPTRVCWAEAPVWAEANWLEHEAVVDDIRRYDRRAA